MVEQVEGRRRTLYLLLVTLGVFYLAYLARAAVVPLAVALLLAYVLAPVVMALEKRGVSRLGAVTMLFLGFFGSTSLALVFGVPPLLEEARVLLQKGLGEPSMTVGMAPSPRLAALLQRSPPPLLDEFLREREAEGGAGGPAPGPGEEGNWERRVREARIARGDEGVRDLRLRTAGWRVALHEGRVLAFDDVDGNRALDAGYVVDLALKAGSYVRERFRTPVAANALEDLGTDVVPRFREVFLSAGAARSALGMLGTVAGILAWAVIVPLYTFYFLMRLEDVWTAFVSYLPGSHRDRVVKVLFQIHRMLIGFFRGRLLTMVLKGIYVALGLGVVGAPFWGVFGAAAGLLTIIPAVGPLAAGVPAAVLAYREGGPVVFGLAMAVLLSAEFVEGYILIPKIVGKEVGLHPMAVITAILIGGGLLGMFGLVLAIPLAAAAKIVWTEFVLPAIRAKAAETPKPPGETIV